MLESIYGQVIKINKNLISLKLESFVFEINILKRDNYIIDNYYNIFTFLSFSTENEFYLYGFLNYNDLILFKKLIKLNGIGTKTALSILQSTKSEELVSLIMDNKYEEISKLPSIGNKANTIYFGLKDKLKEFNYKSDGFIDLYNILVNLGYNKIEVAKVLNKLDLSKSKNDIILQAIKELSNG